MIDNMSIAVYAFAWRMLTSLLIDEIFMPRYGNLSANFRALPLMVVVIPSR